MFDRTRTQQKAFRDELSEKQEVEDRCLERDAMVPMTFETVRIYYTAIILMPSSIIFNILTNFHVIALLRLAFIRF
jgi:hypothetical protein